jgi:alpha,alpha-trehalose phosphorylase
MLSPAALGVSPWLLQESHASAENAALHETLFTVGNGRIGLRGAHEEGSLWPGTTQDAVYINGFYDAEPIHYPENSYGLARHNQFMVSVPNGKAVQWSVDGEAFAPKTGSIENYQRTLDFTTGVLTRKFVWCSPKGRRVQVSSQRLVSFERQYVYALHYALEPLDASARIVIESQIDARQGALTESFDPRVGSSSAANALELKNLRRTDAGLVLTHRTKHSGLDVVSASEAVAHVGGQVLQAGDCGSDHCPGKRFTADVAVGTALVLVKFCALVTSRDFAGEALASEAERQVAQARQVGFEQLRAEQHLYMAKFWQDADVEIEGDAALQQGIRFNLLQLLQSVGRDGRSNIAAKGVTGSGYDGHYFWDTEIYVFPVMLYTRPDIARKLLEFRYNTLDAARARARELAHEQGALFPWRTIAGEECSSYFPAGTAQFHINADIAYAVKRYWEATGDDEFIVHYGAELVFETARLWLGQGHFESGNFANGQTRRFCIHTVTGPDEYTALVNNNLYTNAMAQMHLRLATHIAQWLQVNRPQALQQVASKIVLTLHEQNQWFEAAEAMYLPFDEARGIHPQDDSFLSKPRWEAADVDPAKSPLLLHYHSLVIYRHQICKQADVVLALLLLGEQFDLPSKRRDFDYYEPLTTHDSSLSRCIFGIVASEVGYHDKAYQYFMEGARTDLDDHHHNTANGVHTAAMAGSWLGVVAGFAGLRQSGPQPSFSPTLPSGWTRYAFKLRLHQAQLQVVVERTACTYRLLQGDSLHFVHQGQAVQLSNTQPEIRISLASS